MDAKGQTVTRIGMLRRQLLAARLLAEDRLTDEQIAAEIGIHRQQLWRWKKRPEFAAKVNEYTALIEKEIIRRGIANRARRIQAKQDRWERLQRIIRERAEDPQMQAVPGGATGLLVHDVKQVGSGPYAKTVDVYSLDSALLRAQDALEDAVAQETGQKVHKVAPTTPDGEEEYGAAGFSESERRAIYVAVFAQLGLGGAGPGAPKPLAADRPALAGPDAAIAPLRDECGRLAADGTLLDGGPAHAPLFAPGGQDHHDSSPGAADGLAGSAGDDPGGMPG